MDILNNFSHQLTITEVTGKAQSRVPVRCGIPLPIGEVHSARNILVQGSTGVSWPMHATALSRWQDGSIRWCLLTGAVDLGPHEQLRLRVIESDAPVSPEDTASESMVSETGADLSVTSADYQFTIDKHSFNLFDRIKKADGSVVVDSGYCRLTLENGEVITPACADISHRVSTASDGSHAITVDIHGDFKTEGDRLLANFDCCLEIDCNSNRVKCRFAILNPFPAHHPNGTWDLGDPNSLSFCALELGLHLPGPLAKCQWRAEPELEWADMEGQTLVIHQESSGGDNWNSPNHVNAQSKVTVDYRGYRCSHEQGVVAEGLRASPGFYLETGHGSMSLAVRDFWQNFPKALGFSEGTLNLGLFPRRFNDSFELQPGEKKSHEFYLQLDSAPESLDWVYHPPQISLNSKWIEACNVFPYFQPLQDNPLQRLIDSGLDAQVGFLSKREIIDEYGWRNFGDIFADHETDANDVDASAFVSHYNNQYDPLRGFLQQYALTGKTEWFTLADDLARHVTDIDIYHTRFDKDEYNNGLFWHTDHYQEAKTATHRTYSRRQQKDAYMDHAGGGGPGGQHCYTTGLLYHYYLTGHEPSRQALAGLASWISKVYEGSGTVMDLVLAIKNRHRHDIHNVFTDRYPLDRGTGNYLRALLDMHELTQDSDYLHRVEYIIRHTVHPADNLAERDLLDVEERWYYTVFFQVLARYLRTKEQRKELDEPFYYARDTLLHYADWMVIHERPYLENPDILEFPNNTWAAQDMRKVNVLMYADYFCPDQQTAYRDKAEMIYNDIVERLSADPKHYYARILAILMQNYGVFEYFSALEGKTHFAPTRSYPATTPHNRYQSLKNFARALLKALRGFSPGNELNWLARRSRGAARILRYHP